MNEFMEILTQWHWFGFAAMLVIFEVMLGANFFLLWLGASAVVVALLLMVLPTLLWQYQLLVFAVGSLMCIFFWHLHLRKNPTKSDRPKLNRRSEQYIGRQFTLTEPIVNGRGKIHVDDSIWRVEGDDLPAGTRIKVIDVNGVILKVKHSP